MRCTGPGTELLSSRFSACSAKKIAAVTFAIGVLAERLKSPVRGFSLHPHRKLASLGKPRSGADGLCRIWPAWQCFLAIMKSRSSNNHYVASAVVQNVSDNAAQSVSMLSHLNKVEMTFFRPPPYHGRRIVQFNHTGNAAVFTISR